VKIVILVAFCLVMLVTGMAAAAPVQWLVSAGGNGHYYEAVLGSPGLTWRTASQQAETRGGYLATITSAEENAFVFGLVDSPEFFSSVTGGGPALGGMQDGDEINPLTGWYWVTGEPWSYSNLYYPRPNYGWAVDYYGLQFKSAQQGFPAATWGALGDFDQSLSGYVVEFVPEPSSIVALAGGLVLLLGMRRRK